MRQTALLLETQGRIKAMSTDETGQLMSALEPMQTSLVKIIESVCQNVDGVATANAETAQGNNDLSSRTEQQATHCGGRLPPWESSVPP